MSLTDLDLGRLLYVFYEWEGLDEDDLERLSLTGVRSRAELLPDLLTRLPRDADLRRVGEVEDLLFDEDTFKAMGIADDDPTPGTMEEDLRAMIRPQIMSFVIPIALPGKIETDCELGGRHSLSLRKAKFAAAAPAPAPEGPIEAELMCLSGTVKAGHWASARRIALELTEAVCGVLTALGFLQPHPTFEREYRLHDLFRHLAFIIKYQFQGSERPRKLELPWHIQNHIWQSRIDLPQRLTDMEQRALDDGATDPFQHRLRLLRAPFTVGGPDAQRVRQAARFLRKAATVESPAESYVFLATALEGLFIDDEGDLSKRIGEAVSLLVGTSQEHRRKLRKEVAQLYNVRSRYVHDGTYEGSDPDRLNALALVSGVIAHEVALLAGSQGARDEAEG
jgi:hypothetical protein